ncbi:hypothetical protein BS17DRAFT_779248 [Gyrodon lividus]|nr:hypothetical protein BS17DRAFT_779248 [Gyrodon lividus]
MAGANHADIQVVGPTKGLQHLTKILQRDIKDLGVIMIMRKNGEGEDRNVSTEIRFSASTAPLCGSTSTLHASALW